jgi:hypothetical protein
MSSTTPRNKPAATRGRAKLALDQAAAAIRKTSAADITVTGMHVDGDTLVMNLSSGAPLRVLVAEIRLVIDPRPAAGQQPRIG